MSPLGRWAEARARGGAGAVRDGAGHTGELEERDQEGVADLTSF